MNRILTLSLLLIISYTFNGCKQNEVNGIKIAETLYVHQDYRTNKQHRQLIQDALNHNEQAIPKLTNFPCGSGAGCYDLGFVITQIIYRIGEDNFNQMVLRIDSTDFNKHQLYDLIMVGLEYGDNNNDGKRDNRKIENEFPTLNEILTE